MQGIDDSYDYIDLDGCIKVKLTRDVRTGMRAMDRRTHKKGTVFSIVGGSLQKNDYYFDLKNKKAEIYSATRDQFEVIKSGENNDTTKNS